MNPLEIYRLLPKNNCGECGSKTCMTFALSLMNNPELLHKCRYIDKKGMEFLKKNLSASQWQDALIERLMNEISNLDFNKIYEGIGCELSDSKLILRCLGRIYEINKDGLIFPEPEIKWINILLLHYVRTSGTGDFTNEWISFSDIKGGSVKYSTFERDCVEPLRELFDAGTLKVINILKRLGAVEVSGMPSRYAMSLDILPKVRILIIYDERDEEFPSSLRILFDRITDRFLDVESIIFLCEGLVHTLRFMMSERCSCLRG